MPDRSFVPVCAQKSDEDSIVELEQLVWGSAEEATLAYFRWCLKDPVGQSIVCIIKDDSDRVLSMGMLICIPARLKGKLIMAGMLMNGVTHPNHRRKGFSNQIVHFIFAEARNLGIEFLFSVTNLMSHRQFTEKNNFTDIGRPLLLVRWTDLGILIRQSGFPNLAKNLSFLTKSVSRIFTKGKTGFSKVRHVEDLRGLKVEKILEPTDFHFAVDGRWLNWRYRQHPFKKYECAIVGDLESPQAVVVYQLMAQYKRALIMEFLVMQEVSLEILQVLMEGVVEKCKAEGCSFVCSLGSPLSRKTDLLKKCGFFGFPFDSIWRPKIVLSSHKPLPAKFSLSSMDISYGTLINVG